MADIKSLLDEKIESGINNLSNFKSGSKERAEAVEDLVQLHQLRIEEIKAETAMNKEKAEAELKRKELESNSEFHDSEICEKRKDRLMRFGVGASQVAALIIFGAIGLAIEKDGIISNPTLKKICSSATSMFSKK